jgi:hypothetical protein
MNRYPLPRLWPDLVRVVREDKVDGMKVVRIWHTKASEELIVGKHGIHTVGSDGPIDQRDQDYLCAEIRRWLLSRPLVREVTLDTSGVLILSLDPTRFDAVNDKESQHPRITCGTELDRHIHALFMVLKKEEADGS